MDSKKAFSHSGFNVVCALEIFSVHFFCEHRSILFFLTMDFGSLVGKYVVASDLGRINLSSFLENAEIEIDVQDCLDNLISIVVENETGEFYLKKWQNCLLVTQNSDGSWNMLRTDGMER